MTPEIDALFGQLRDYIPTWSKIMSADPALVQATAGISISTKESVAHTALLVKKVLEMVDRAPVYDVRRVYPLVEEMAEQNMKIHYPMFTTLPAPSCFVHLGGFIDVRGTDELPEEDLSREEVELRVFCNKDPNLRSLAKKYPNVHVLFEPDDFAVPAGLENLALLTSFPLALLVEILIAEMSVAAMDMKEQAGEALTEQEQYRKRAGQHNIRNIKERSLITGTRHEVIPFKDLYGTRKMVPADPVKISCAFDLIAQQNLFVQRETTPPRPFRRRMEREGRKWRTYQVIDFARSYSHGNGSGHEDFVGHHKALHFCSGHWRHSDGPKSRLVDGIRKTWIEGHWRGDPAYGVVTKGYVTGRKFIEARGAAGAA